MQVPGVEADDVIGTLAVKSVDAGYKVYSKALFFKESGMPKSTLVKIIAYSNEHSIV